MRKRLKTAQTPIHNSSKTRNKEYLVVEQYIPLKGNNGPKNKERKEFIENVATKFNFANQSKKGTIKFINSFKERWKRKILRRKMKVERSIAAGRPIRKRKHRYTYSEYIKSPEWAQRRNSFYKEFGRRCKACGSTTYVELHHMVYTAFDGTEPNRNLVALCKSHHADYHNRYGSAGNMLETTHIFLEEILNNSGFIRNL